MRVIKCWEDAMVQMQVGEKADIGCPSATAYGAKSKPKIPANSDLIFNVEVVSCEWKKAQSSRFEIWNKNIKATKRSFEQIQKTNETEINLFW